MAFLRRWPELVRTSTWSWRASASRSIRVMMSRIASAPMPALNRRPCRPGAVALLERCAARSRRGSCSGLSALELVAQPGGPRPSGPGPARRAARARARSVSSMAARRSATFCSTARGLVALALLDLLVDALGLGRDDLAQAAVAALPPFSPAATMTSPVGSKTMVSSAAPVLSSASRASTAWAAATICLGPDGPLGLELLAGRGEGCAASSSVVRSMSARSSSSSSARRWPALPPRPAASSSSWPAARRAGVLVDVRHDDRAK